MTHERALRQAERAAKARQREIERARKEMAKLSAIEQARLEVAEFENQIELLLSLHKESSPSVDWDTFGNLIPPIPPIRVPRKELANLLDRARNCSGTIGADTVLDAPLGRIDDDATHRANMLDHQRAIEEWKRVRVLARRVLAGEPRAYTEALTEFSNLSEISALGSAVEITVHSPRLVECRLNVKGREAIPTEVKTLTSSGKVSVKSMPKGRFHEIYQDYVCSAVLRLARVITTTLPVHTVIVTASVEETASHSGNTREVPILSVAITRAGLDLLNFETLDPSDSMECFTRRGDVTQIGGTLGISAKIREGIDHMRELDAIFTQLYRKDPVMLALWKVANRATPYANESTAPVPAPEPVPGDGSGSGSGS